MPLTNVRIQDLASYKCGSRCRCSLRKHPFLLALRRWGRWNVPSGEEREETDVFAGYCRCEISHVLKAVSIVNSVRVNLSTILMVSHFMSAKVSLANEGQTWVSGPMQKKWPFPLNRGFPFNRGRKYRKSSIKLKPLGGEGGGGLIYFKPVWGGFIWEGAYLI